MSTFILPYERKETDEDIIASYDKVFNTPDGRVVLNHLLGEVCDLARVSMPTDEKGVFKNIGRQQAGLRILSILNPTKGKDND